MSSSVSTPLIINLPPFPVRDIDDVESYLPSFLHRFPSATIHYRWANSPETRAHQLGDETSATEAESADLLSRSTPLHWPTPINDTLFAYDFLIRHLSPPLNPTTGTVLRRRSVYVFGSYLGASLASSLALTESHTHKPVAIRGLLAFNGIFNWTTLLPDHPHKKLMQYEPPDMDILYDNDKDIGFAKGLMPSHFDQPANLFDPFASPVLFFHTAGMLVPTSFTERSPTPNRSQDLLDPVDQFPSQGSSTLSADVPQEMDDVYSDWEDPPPPMAYEDIERDTGTEDRKTNTSSSADSQAPTSPKFPRRGYVVFPPRASSLKIPETLLMHTNPAAPGAAENSFATQALGLAMLMRRSINLHELKERARWDFEFTGWETEALRRVQVQDVGTKAAAGAHGLGRRGEEIAARWLTSKLG
ncbi:hypothetical protein DHEL01_v201802 [Diaporthe helianthi]|uniref:Alpha/beta hydrolase fold-3 domain-containing protein n=1 Tax=Diaporthe helianthi TaxID=158607 RepID=A0A2P5IBB9_DIAHE|nr:hypothetical protein DHEL01_v201802 [Diaporthe helianthi]